LKNLKSYKPSGKTGGIPKKRGIQSKINLERKLGRSKINLALKIGQKQNKFGTKIGSTSQPIDIQIIIFKEGFYLKPISRKGAKTQR